MYAYYSCTFLAIICNTTAIKIVNKYNDEVNMYVGVSTGVLGHYSPILLKLPWELLLIG